MRKTIKLLSDCAETLKKHVEQKYYVIDSCKKSNYPTGKYIGFDVEDGEIHAIIEYNDIFGTYTQYHYIPTEYLEMTDDELIKHLKGETERKNEEKVIHTYNWDERIYGGLSKTEIRNLSDGVFFNDVFTTVIDCVETKGRMEFKLELENAMKHKLDSSMGELYAFKLSESSTTHNFEFIKYDYSIQTVDLHDYEPTKIAVGTFTEITHVYIILEATKKQY